MKNTKTPVSSEKHWNTLPSWKMLVLWGYTALPRYPMDPRSPEAKGTTRKAQERISLSFQCERKDSSFSAWRILWQSAGESSWRDSISLCHCKVAGEKTGELLKVFFLCWASVACVTNIWSFWAYCKTITFWFIASHISSAMCCTESPINPAADVCVHLICEAMPGWASFSILCFLLPVHLKRLCSILLAANPSSTNPTA